jgi:hypothetical protein
MKKETEVILKASAFCERMTFFIKIHLMPILVFFGGKKNRKTQNVFRQYVAGTGIRFLSLV